MFAGRPLSSPARKRCVSPRSLVMQRNARFRCSQILAATESHKRSIAELQLDF